MAERAWLQCVVVQFAQQELQLASRLDAVQRRRRQFHCRINTVDTKNPAISKTQALKRNKSLLKEVELQAAKLRSRSIFCPTYLHLNTLKKKYQESS
ncbi:uncharacterized protein LOC134540992 isoform X2 [Bacillus rossius redtenbacheri]